MGPNHAMEHDMMAARWETLYGRVMRKVRAGIWDVEALSETSPTLAEVKILVLLPDLMVRLDPSSTLA